MVIKASSAAEIKPLIEALGSSDAVRREAAIARLAVIGGRATDRLLGAYSSAGDNETKVGILRALETIASARVLPLACEALQEGGDVAEAAASVLKPFLDSTESASAAAALDALVEAALDPARERRVRFAAYTALQNIPAGMLAKVTDALKVTIPSVEGDDGAHEALLADAFDGRLPGDPAKLRHAVIAKGSSAPLGSLQKLIDAVRVRERGAKPGPQRAAWQQARGAAHHVLAFRGSRIALYDLRETLETAAEPLPASFLSAMRGVGDASCIEALASALARAPEQDLWWRHQLASALRGITRRERITKRHPSMKRALARWPRAADALV